MLEKGAPGAGVMVAGASKGCGGMLAGVSMAPGATLAGGWDGWLADAGSPPPC